MNLVYQIRKLNHNKINLSTKFYFIIKCILYIYFYYFININYIKDFFVGFAIWKVFNNTLFADQMILFALYILIL